MRSWLPPAIAAAFASTAACAALATVAPAGLVEVQELAKAGRGGEALRRIDALIAKAPQDPQLRFQKGVLLVEQKRTAEAIALFERMGREYPSFPEPLNNLAVLYAEQGQMEKARAALEAAVRSRPSYDTAYQNLSSVNVRMASRAYAKALQIDDSATAPKLALLKTLNGSAQDAVVAPSPTASGAGTAPASSPPPSPAPATPPAPAPAPAPVVTPPAPAGGDGRADPPPAGPADAPRSNPGTGTGTDTNATATTAQRRSTEEAKEVNQALRAWASAWESKDMPAYFAAYVPGFKGSERDASAWQSSRKQRILGKSRISVELSGVTVELTAPGVVKASFRQSYSADRLQVSGQKSLELVKRDGKWLIRKESVGS